MKRYYEQGLFGTTFKYGGHAYFISKMCAVSNRNTINTLNFVYTFDSAIEHIQNSTTIIRHLDISRVQNRVPICSPISEYYITIGQLYINKNQFNIKPMITEIK